MNCEELLMLEKNNGAVSEVPTQNCVEQQQLLMVDDPAKLEKKRERLASIALGGQSRQYFGKNVSAADVDNMNPQEIDKLYTRYEARLGASMTKTLGQAAIQLYATIAGRFLPIPVEKQHFLASDLEADPFVSHAMTTAACELYYRYGFYMAPLTAAMTTMKYCQFGQKEIDSNKSDGKSEQFEQSERFEQSEQSEQSELNCEE